MCAHVHVACLFCPRSYPKFWSVTFLYDKNEEVREWNVVLACAFRKGHVHVAMCTWRMWFEHVHVKEGPRDAGEKTDWDFEVGGPSYCENKSG